MIPVRKVLTWLARDGSTEPNHAKYYAALAEALGDDDGDRPLLDNPRSQSVATFEACVEAVALSSATPPRMSEEARKHAHAIFQQAFDDLLEGGSGDMVLVRHHTQTAASFRMARGSAS